MYYALPPGCPSYGYGGYGYYHCGGVYYEPRYEGDTVVYVTVPDPSGGKAPAQDGAAPPARPSGSTSAPRPSGGPPQAPPPTPPG
jgi:hypothetical protein